MIDPEIERIAMGIPEIRDRAKMISALAILSQPTQAQTPKGFIHLEDACRWLEDKWPTNTVRAKAIRKAAQMLRESGLGETQADDTTTPTFPVHASAQQQPAQT